MVEMSVHYTGSKHCELRHGPSGSTLETDAPRDNRGKGERFSPTDLLGAALGSCILTTIAILGETEGINIDGAKAVVVKEMASQPRRVSKLTVNLTLPATLTSAQRKRVEEIAANCPVTKSLHPQIGLPMSFHYA